MFAAYRRGNRMTAPTHRLAVAAFGLLLALGCARDLNSLETFPCADDNTCPEGFSCANKTCVLVRACDSDDTCASETTSEVPLVCLSGEVCVAPETCDVVVQNCKAPRSKCTLALVDDKVAPQCVVPETSSSGKVGEACTWQKLEADYFGRDSCAAGLSCSPYYSAPESLIAGAACLKLCRKDLDCPSGAQCAKFTDAVGMCAGRCELHGVDCPSDRDCKWVGNLRGDAAEHYVAACVPQDGTVRGGRCTGAADCAAGYDCWKSGSTTATCKRMCDETHACSDGDQCYSTEKAPNGGGVCGCSLFDTRCGTGRTCRMIGAVADGVYTECSADGTAGEGASCNSAACAAGLECWSTDVSSGAYFCRRLCNDSHPCPTGKTCHKVAAIYDGGGVCL